MPVIIKTMPGESHGELLKAIAGRKRWPVAAAAIVIEFVIGSVYAWSVFKTPLMGMHGWSAPQVGMTFTLAIVFLAVSAAMGGGLIDRVNTVRLGLGAAVLFGAGTMLAGAAAAKGSLWLLWLGYGVIAGTGAGLCYTIPIRVLLQWFPDKKGTITGLAIMGFGLGAAAVAQAAPVMIAKAGIAKTLYMLGGVDLTLLAAASMKMRGPQCFCKLPAAAKKENDGSVSLGGAMRMSQFYILWLVLFINVMGGIALISNLAPMVQGRFGLSSVAAGTVLLAGSLANAAGRLFWGHMSERIGRKRALQLIFITQVPLFVLLPAIGNLWVFTAAVCWILLCYGGGFGVMPSTAGDTFGTANIGRIYGCILLAWGAGGAAGPMLMEFVKTHMGDFRMALYVAAGAVTLGLGVISFYKKSKNLTTD